MDTEDTAPVVPEDLFSGDGHAYLMGVFGADPTREDWTIRDGRLWHAEPLLAWTCPACGATGTCGVGAQPHVFAHKQVQQLTVEMTHGDPVEAAADGQGMMELHQPVESV